MIALILFCFSSYAQENKQRIVWFLPSVNTTINGIGIGPIFEPLDYPQRDTTNTLVNGLAIEIIGFGIVMPLFPKSSFFPVDTTRLDSILYAKLKISKGINGLIISPGGHIGETKVNGVNLSGIGTETLISNGLSFGMICSHFRVNGLTIAVFNESVRHYGAQLGFSNAAHLNKGVQIGAFNDVADIRGVQIGAFNKAEKLKGVQIGLWNINQKRKFPIINWSIK